MYGKGAETACMGIAYFMMGMLCMLLFSESLRFGKISMPSSNKEHDGQLRRNQGFPRQKGYHSMAFEILNQNNVEDYIAYLRVAMSEEPDKMTAESIDEPGIKNRVSDSFFGRTTSILAREDGRVVGRIMKKRCFPGRYRIDTALGEGGKT